MKSKRKATLSQRDRIGNHRIARRSANSFTDAIRKSNRQHLMPVTGKREQRPHHRRERITTHDQKLSSTESIAEMTREQFQQTRDRLSESFNDSDRACRSTERGSEEDRK